jgi:hypothetical protein
VATMKDGKRELHYVPQFGIGDPLPAGVPYDPYKFARCAHHYRSLRGCWLPKGHSGEHHNPNLNGTECWDDTDGVYVNSQEDWVGLVNLLGAEHGSEHC